MVVNQQEKNWYFFKSFLKILNVWLLMLQPNLGLETNSQRWHFKMSFSSPQKQKIIDV